MGSPWREQSCHLNGPLEYTTRSRQENLEFISVFTTQGRMSQMGDIFDRYYATRENAEMTMKRTDALGIMDNAARTFREEFFNLIQRPESISGPNVCVFVFVFLCKFQNTFFLIFFKM